MTTTQRVIHVPQDATEDVTVIHVAPDFDALAEHLGGMIECLTGDCDIDLWTNPYARTHGLDINTRATRLAVGLDFMSPAYAARNPLRGPVIVSAVDHLNANLGARIISIPDSQIGPILTELVARDDVIDPIVSDLI